MPRDGYNRHEGALNTLYYLRHKSFFLLDVRVSNDQDFNGPLNNISKPVYVAVCQKKALELLVAFLSAALDHIKGHNVLFCHKVAQALLA